MPNNYHYFESGEVSDERLLLEIQLLKQLQKENLLENLDWKSYDTFALEIFSKEGIREVNNEISKSIEYNHFIQQCIIKHEKSIIKENFQQKQQRFSLPLIINIIFIFICLFFVIGLFIYEYIHYNHQHPLFNSLEHPLTTKRRHLLFTDDLSIILLTFTTTLILTSTIIATGLNKKIILFAIILILIIIIYLIIKGHQILTFLSKYRELRWTIVYDYIYS